MGCFIRFVFGSPFCLILPNRCCRPQYHFLAEVLCKSISKFIFSEYINIDCQYVLSPRTELGTVRLPWKSRYCNPLVYLYLISVYLPYFCPWQLWRAQIQIVSLQSKSNSIMSWSHCGQQRKGTFSSMVLDVLLWVWCFVGSYNTFHFTSHHITDGTQR